MIDERFIILGALLSFIGVFSYLYDVIRGRVQPNKVTWFLWAIIPFIAFIAEIRQGVGLPSLLTFMSGFNPFLIFLVSFINKKAYWDVSRLDITCGVLSLAGVMLWYVTQVGNIAILFSILADGLAAVPTLVKAYRHPQTENYKFFLINLISNTITFLAIRTWTFAYWGFPLYLFLCNLVLFVLIRFRLGIRLKQSSGSSGA